jgi:hypothetical protein
MLSLVWSRLPALLSDEDEPKLRRMLRAWCILRPDVGYAQGMNIVGALCLALLGCVNTERLRRSRLLFDGARSCARACANTARTNPAPSPSSLHSSRVRAPSTTPRHPLRSRASSATRVTRDSNRHPYQCSSHHAVRTRV